MNQYLWGTSPYSPSWVEEGSSTPLDSYRVGYDEVVLPSFPRIWVRTVGQMVLNP